MKYYSPSETQKLLPWAPLVEVLAQAVAEYACGRISCPERTVLPSVGGNKGQLLCMPVTSEDLLVTKLLTIFPTNATQDRPTIQGQVTCADGLTGTFLFGLDGEVVTMRRTAAMSLLAVRLLYGRPPQRILIIGTGLQAKAHVEGLCTLYPEVEIAIRGRTSQATQRLCNACLHLNVRAAEPSEKGFDVVITVTASKDILYDEPAHPDCLVIAVGAYRPDMIEVGPAIVKNSLIYVDDPVAAPLEAGDIIQARVDWTLVRPLADACKRSRLSGRPVFFKSIGCGTWDLAACRLARQQINAVTGNNL